jgi:adenylate cyclase
LVVGQQGTTRCSIGLSTDFFAKAIAQDPDYGEPYAGVAMAHVLNWQNHWTGDWSRSLENAEQNISLALQKSPQVAFVHCIAAVFFLWKRDLGRSAAEASAG